LGKHKRPSTAKTSRQPIQRAVNVYLEYPSEDNAVLVMKACESLLWWYIHHLHVHKSLVADMIQEIRLSTWKALQNYSPQKALFTTYLHKNVIGVIRRNIQKTTEYHNQESIELKDEYQLDPWNSIDNQLDIERAISTLSVIQQKVIRSIYYEGLSSTQISEIVNLNSVTVRQIHKQALQKIKEVLINHNKFNN
jgi:RNA polymerase sigma factor (sigma-70 family)